jgi:NADH:ubiquinone oxidoreductase subunit F (NADH-binding)
MGGAGFPTGRKWQLVATETADSKYVICNADESEPGSFKDRVLLSTVPHLVIEGMVLAGLTVGADRGILFLRHEYSLEQQVLAAALQTAAARGILGENVAGSGRSFEIEIFVSPGGYILGEETALLEALEDRRGEPRNKPPYPGQHGLFGQPTLINNVETLALAVPIIHHGSTWWSDQGRPGFDGLKFVSISGDVVEPGVYELPVGTTVAELIERAGGMAGGRSVKAFLPGGASSRFLPADRLDTPLDFDTIAAAGSMLGSGAVVVVAEGRNLFELATGLVRFFRNESCGKCVPCRIGSHRAVGLLESVAAGSAGPDVLEELTPLGDTLEQTSLCGLGQVALAPILSMLEHFPAEVPAP